MPPSALPPLFLIIAAIFSIALYLLYRSLLPKPLPGIPYKALSAKRILGDIPDCTEWQKEHGDLFPVFAQRFQELNTPIYQAFFRPGGRPWVMVSDYREARDVMTRRTREFDRSDFFGDAFAGILPNNHVGMKTGPEWTAHRQLMNDTMSPRFLQDVVSSEIWGTVMDLTRLWEQKMRLAEGRAFDVHDDVHKEALEAVWTAAFGSGPGSTKAQIKLLESMETRDLPSSSSSAIVFPVAKDEAAFTSILTLTDSMEIPIGSPFPKQHHRFALTFYPYLVSALKDKNALLKARLREAWQTFSKASIGDDEKDDRVKSALDLIVAKEAQMARKEDRAPAYDTPAIRDELYGFLVAGNETTSTTVMWALKYLTAYPHVQKQLRSALESAFAAAKENDSIPSADEIVKSQVPYLDAFIAETLRASNVASGVIRVATVDTTLMGYHIPKGTDVFFMNNGPGYKLPTIGVDESKRSKSSQDSKDKDGAVWDDSTIEEFNPDRWLAKDEKGHMVYDPKAGPSIPFGAGPRSCFGRSRPFSHIP